MIKHTLEISEFPAKLKLKDKQLVLVFDENKERSFSCEDIGFLLLQHPAINLTGAAATALMEAGAVIIFCDRNYMPTGVLLPISTHTEVISRLYEQIDATLPNRKQLWKQLVQAKITAQSQHVLPPVQTKLIALADKIRSGDPENIEAQASKIYWSARFPDQYQVHDKRNPDSDSLFNILLNYGYSIVRAAVARGLVSAGLQPAIGVHHHRRNNPFCLADDIMEPLRPLVDNSVADLLIKYGSNAEFGKEHRRYLLELLTHTVSFDGQQGPLMVQLPRFIASAYNVLTGKADKLITPIY